MLNDLSASGQSDKPRFLIFSLRNIFGKALFRCPHFEFEDIICDIDSAELFAPVLSNPHNMRTELAMRLAYHAPVVLNPNIQGKPKEKQYDVFFSVCGGLASPYDLLMLNAVSAVKDICKISVCLLDEVWVKQLSKHRHFLRVIEKFDYVFLYYSQTVKPLSEMIGRRCYFLPPGIDATLFCPYPHPPKRVVDVYSIGRRSETTHQKLVNMVQQHGLFYLHDSIRGDQAVNSMQHRALFANVAKRSRYFIVNPGLIDQPEKRGDQIEIGNRYFEGAASGAIMIGERPDNEQFEKLFDWPDAVRHLPFNAGDIDLLIKKLDREELEAARQTGVERALTRYDWAYRWETILQTIGLEPKQMLLDRKKRLKQLAEVVAQEKQGRMEALT